MPTTRTLLAFSLVAAAFVAVPGPSNLFVLGRGLQSGTGAALAGAAGCATGALAYVVATAAGLAALIAASQPACAALHYAGAAYLCWLGVSALRSRRLGSEAAAGSPSTWRSYRQGVLVELGNPKVALFFLALFPQFLEVDAGATETQVLVLGTVFVGIGLISDSLYALGSRRLRTWLMRRPGRRAAHQRATGALYLGLGSWTAGSGTS